MSKLTEDNVHNIGGPSSTAGGGSGIGGFGERLARLEEKVNHLATSKDISDLKEVIMKNDAEVRDLVHENQMKIQEQRMTTLKWGVGLFVTSTIAVIVAVVAVLSNTPPVG